MLFLSTTLAAAPVAAAPTQSSAPAPVETCVTADQPSKAPSLASCSPPTPCDVEVYVALEKGPIPVHDAPGAVPRGALPAHRPEQGLSGGPILHITASAPGGWLHYDAIDAFGTPLPGASPAPASGWVRNTHLAVDLAMSEVSPALMKPWTLTLREEPTETSRVVATYLQEAARVSVQSCAGTWVRAEVDTTEKRTGWLADHDHCGHPITTCGGKTRPEP